MIDEKILNYNIDELETWLIEEAGSNCADHFGVKFTGNLHLQQIPKEYSKLLLWLKHKNIKSYMAIGIGNGGSFITECFMMKNTLKTAVAVDNISYTKTEQRLEDITKKINWISNILPNANIRLECSDSKEYLKKENQRYDCIFIDGDHTYEGVKSDYEYSKNLSNILIFHDINSQSCPGVVSLWNEINCKEKIEFVHSNSCGIGIALL